MCKRSVKNFYVLLHVHCFPGLNIQVVRMSLTLSRFLMVCAGVPLTPVRPGQHHYLIISFQCLEHIYDPLLTLILFVDYFFLNHSLQGIQRSKISEVIWECFKDD